MNLESRVRDILSDSLAVPATALAEEARLRADLGATSIEIVEIVASLENEFGVSISDEEAASIDTVGAVFEFIRGKMESAVA